MNKPLKIPTLLALALLVIIVASVVFVVNQTTKFTAKASESIEPHDIQITNESDMIFTITWLTDTEAGGFIKVTTPENKSFTYYDDRDSPGKAEKYITHSITAKNLLPDTSYTVDIYSTSSFITKTKQVATQTSPQISSQNSPLEPAYGTVMLPNNTPADGALVYLKLEGSQVISTLTKPSGTWILPLNTLRTLSKAESLPTQDRMTEQLTVVYKDASATAVTDTLNDSPVPLMVLGKSYDFRKQQAKANSTLSQLNTNQNTNVLGSETTNKEMKFTLSQPLENAALSTFSPLIQGSGIPGKTTTITLGITNPTVGTTQVGQDGIWRYTPTKQLSPGKQRVTATSVDATGKPIAITHTFTIFKSGTQVLGDATPSASLTPTVSQSISPSPTIFIEPTEEATQEAQTPPITGTSFPLIVLLVISVALLSGGTVALLK